MWSSVPSHSFHLLFQPQAAPPSTIIPSGLLQASESNPMATTMIACAPSSIFHNLEQEYGSSEVPINYGSLPLDQSSSAPPLSLEQRLEGLSIVTMPPHHLMSSLVSSGACQTPSTHSSLGLTTTVSDRKDGDERLSREGGPAIAKSEQLCSSCTLTTQVLMRQRQVPISTKEINGKDFEREKKYRTQMIRLL